MSQSKVRTVVTPAIRQFITALRDVADAASSAAAALAAFSRTHGRRESLEARRSRFGGMTEDLRRWPDQWQSFYCAGFLCEMCPNDVHDLGCTHSCHEKA